MNDLKPTLKKTELRYSSPSPPFPNHQTDNILFRLRERNQSYLRIEDQRVEDGARRFAADVLVYRVDPDSF